jgi:hypothetical protein
LPILVEPGRRILREFASVLHHRDRGAGQVRRAGAQRGQTVGEPGKWPQGWRGQKPQEGHGGAPQCTPTASWASEVNRVMMLIRARHGEWAIGRAIAAFDIAPPSNRGQPRGTGGSNVINSVTLRIYTVVARCRYGGSEGFGRRQIAETQIRLHLLAPSMFDRTAV